MFKQHPGLIAMVLFILISCNNDDGCGTASCPVTDDTISLRLVDQETFANMIADGRIAAEDISIVDNNQEVIAFNITKDFNGQDVIVINLQGQGLGSTRFQVGITNGALFTLSLDTSLQESECCGRYTGIENVVLNGAESDFKDFGLLPLNITVFIGVQ